MNRLKLTILFAACVAAASAQAASPQIPFTLKSTSVELPNSDRTFPQATGVDTISANCVTCHSPGMILNQPSLSKAAWEGEVHKMVSVYKAPVSDEDAAVIANYLATIKGKP